MKKYVVNWTVNCCSTSGMSDFSSLKKAKSYGHKCMTGELFTHNWGEYTVSLAENMQPIYRVRCWKNMSGNLGYMPVEL